MLIRCPSVYWQRRARAEGWLDAQCDTEACATLLPMCHHFHENRDESRECPGSWSTRISSPWRATRGATIAPVDDTCGHLLPISPTPSTASRCKNSRAEPPRLLRNSMRLASAVRFY